MKNISLLLSIFLFLLTSGPVGRQFQRTDPQISLETPEISVSAPPPAAPASQSTPTPPGQADANSAALSFIFVDGPGGDVFTAQDNMLHSGFPTISFAVHERYDVSLARRFIQRFDLSAIPAGNQCISATVYYVKQYSRSNDEVNVTIYSISQANGDWQEGESPDGEAGPGESSWRFKAAPTRWAGSDGLSTAGVDYETPSIGSFKIPANAQDKQVYTAPLNCDRVEGWFGPNNTNYGILLVADGAAEYVGAAENREVVYIPKLVVEYSGSEATVTPTGTATRTPTTTRTPTATRTRDPNLTNFNYIPLSINQ